MNEYLPKYHQGPEAVVINVSSLGVFLNVHELPVYMGTKHAVLGFTKCWGSEEIYRKTKIRVVAVCPGLTNTPILENLDKKLLPNLLVDKFDLTGIQLQE